MILDSTPTAVAGLTATVYANVYNYGPSTAQGTVVTITLPPGTSYNTATLPSGWYATPNVDGTVTITTAEVLTPGAGIPLSLVVNIAPDVQPGSSLAFVGAVSSQTADFNPTNNLAIADTSVNGAADLVISKTGDMTATAGAQVSYVITVVNKGPSVASIRDLKDVLPPGVSLVNATLARADGTLSACAAAICQTSRPITVGEIITMTVVGKVDPSLPAGTILTDTAAVFAENLSPDPDLSNNVDDQRTTVTTLAQLAIDKYDLIDPVNPDALLVYAIVVTNTGPSDAQDVVVTDTLPAGVTYHSDTGGCTANGNVLTCPLGVLAAGDRVSFQVVVFVNANVPNGATLHNAVVLTSSTPLTNSILADAADTRVVVSTGPLADLAVTKTASSLYVLAGGLVTFTIVVTNNGPSPVNSVSLADLLPTGLTLVSVKSSQGFCGAGINCLLGTLNFNTLVSPTLRGTAVITVVARADTGLAEGDLLVNQAFVQSERQDPTPENNIAEASVTVNTWADLSLVKTVSPATVAAGRSVLYTLVVRNAGPSAATNVVVTDTLPPSVTVAAAPGCAINLGTVVCSLGAMAVGAQKTIDFVVTVAPDATGVLTNTATVDSATRDGDPSNNTGSAPLTVTQEADLSITKVDVIGFSTAGEPITYTLVVVNHGPSVAYDVTVSDLLPPQLTYRQRHANAGGRSACCACLGARCFGAGRIDVDPTGRAVGCESGCWPTDLQHGDGDLHGIRPNPDQQCGHRPIAGLWCGRSGRREGGGSHRGDSR